MYLGSRILLKPTFHSAALLMLLALFVAGCSTSQTLELAPPPAPAAAAGKYAAIVIDANSGRTLFSANAEAPRYPASLTKMMTLYMLFEALESGRISKTTQIPVSAYAASRPPTKMGLRPGETIDVESAIRALATKSANDVAVAVGEFLAGSEEAFAAAMTARTRQIGMRGTVFRNASGLPDDGQITTARDMAVLGMRLRQRFPTAASPSADAPSAVTTILWAVSRAWTASRPAISAPPASTLPPRSISTDAGWWWW